MRYKRASGKTKLEKLFLNDVEINTPTHIKSNTLIDLNNENNFIFRIDRSHLKSLKEGGLGLSDWFETYKEEAKISTAGIRGLQNPLYPWDTRYPLNLVGVLLATFGKIQVAKKSTDKIEKISACEVRYNSKQYLELISRVQAAYGIKTYVTENYNTTPIFLISFIIFILDLYGGEYVTSSHAMCKKIATKDLNAQGSQYIPSESLQFVREIEKILKIVETKGFYDIVISKLGDPLIDRKYLKSINNGIDLYVEYLKKGIATKENIDLIKSFSKNIIVDCVGGSMNNTLLPVLKILDIQNKFDLIRTNEDPFNYETGKLIDNDGNFYDWGCDTTIMKVNLNTLDIKTPVIDTIDYENLLSNYPIGSVLMITDPDADRLVLAYIDIDNNSQMVENLGVVYRKIGKGRILVMFTPNQSFLMTIDFQTKALKKSKLWNKYDWFILKTSASQRSWDEWALANNVPVVNTPVGFKELADTMQVIENKIKMKEDVFIKDVFGKKIHIGRNPRLLFAGEESGGEIFGPSELIKSKKGRVAISMREKSAGEAVIISSAMVSWLEKNKLTLLEYLALIFRENNISSVYEIRIDNKYYNESEPIIEKLNKEKEKGIQIRIKNDSYFLSLALAYKDRLISIDQIKKVLKEAFPDLIFDDMLDIKFAGDGTYLLFTSKCVEIRPSGTDAVNKAYSYGKDRWENIKYAKAFAEFSGERGLLHKKYINDKYYENIKDYSFKLYTYYKEHQ